MSEYHEFCTMHTNPENWKTIPCETFIKTHRKTTVHGGLFF